MNDAVTAGLEFARTRSRREVLRAQIQFHADLLPKLEGSPGLAAPVRAHLETSVAELLAAERKLGEGVSLSRIVGWTLTSGLLAGLYAIPALKQENLWWHYTGYALAAVAVVAAVVLLFLAATFVQMTKDLLDSPAFVASVQQVVVDTGLLAADDRPEGKDTRPGTSPS